MKMVSIFNSTIPDCLTPLLSFIIGMKKWIGATVVLLSDCKQKGVVSLKRGNSFLVQKKHSDYENPNACGRM